MVAEVRYQYIHFVRVGEKPKTSVWSCRNNRSGGELGTVEWYGPWRQYCFLPSGPSVYSDGCLQDIQTFIEQIKKD